MNRSLSIAALTAGVLGSLGAGRSVDPDRLPFEIVVRSFSDRPTALVQAMPIACGCVPRIPHEVLAVGAGWAVHTENHVPGPCAEGLFIDVEAGFEGTGTMSVGTCDLTFTAEHDARFPTRWTGPRDTYAATSPYHLTSIDPTADILARGNTGTIAMSVHSTDYDQTTWRLPVPRMCSSPWVLPEVLDTLSSRSGPSSNGGDRPSIRVFEEDELEFTVHVPAMATGLTTLRLGSCELLLEASLSHDRPASHDTHPVYRRNCRERSRGDEHDVAFPTHWTAPRPTKEDIEAMWSGEGEPAEPPPEPTPRPPVLPAMRLQSDPLWARQTGSIPFPAVCLADEHGSDSVPRDWARLDGPAVRVPTHPVDRPTMRVRLPTAWRGSTELQVGSCTIPVEVDFVLDAPTHPTEPALEIAAYVESHPETTRVVEAIPIPGICGPPTSTPTAPVQATWSGGVARISIDPGFRGQHSLRLGRCTIEVDADVHRVWTSHDTTDMLIIRSHHGTVHVEKHKN